ncbi:MAG TPA: YlmC/YmxH family sporulation protein [Firmicutes bacterium]|nr:YlmC/YmxH family sporulation protein [Bacillota bacterium]
MNLSDLQTKDIISTKDGRRMGHIVDAEINMQGRIVFLVVEEKKSMKKLLSNQEIKISFDNISKIGEDVILVDL